MKRYFFECRNDFPGVYYIEAYNDAHAVYLATKKSIVEIKKPLLRVFEDTTGKMIFQNEEAF